MIFNLLTTARTLFVDKPIMFILTFLATKLLPFTAFVEDFTTKQAISHKPNLLKNKHGNNALFNII